MIDEVSIDVKCGFLNCPDCRRVPFKAYPSGNTILHTNRCERVRGSGQNLAVFFEKLDEFV